MVGAIDRTKNLLVTVGTTKFDLLIDTILTEQVSRELLELGYTNWRLQIGKASIDVRTKIEQFKLAISSKIRVEVFEYKSSLEGDFEWSHLVIGHAGAGTILDALRGPSSGKGKSDRPFLLIVENETLMHGHQAELARELQRLNICASCTVNEFRWEPDEVLRRAHESKSSLPEPNVEGFEAELRHLLNS